MHNSIPKLLLTSTLLFACSGSSGTDDDDTKLPPIGDLTCPASTVAGTFTVCDLKLEAGVNQPTIGDPVIVENAIATTSSYSILEDRDTGDTTLAGFFVQDPTTDDKLKGRFSGILVTYRPNDIQGTLPNAGDAVRVTGVYRDFGQMGDARQKQIEASLVEVTGSGSIDAITVADPSSIATGGTAGPGYEGVLVKVNNVVADLVRDIPGAGQSTIFGAFRVTGGLVVSGEIFQYPATAQETFTSITGVLRIGTAPFDSGIYLLTPTRREDVVSTNPIETISDIVTLQNPAAPGRPTMCERTGAATVGRCAQVKLTNVAVTAKGGFVSGDLRALWVQDPSVTDGRFAGVKVVYNQNDAGLPEVGDMIDVDGEAIEWFRGTQVQFPSFNKVGTSSVTPTVVLAADVVRTSQPETNPWEGVLIRVETSSVTERCVDSNGRDFGNWVVDGTVFIGTAWNYDYNGGFGPSTAMCNMASVDCSCAGMSRPDDMRTVGDTFRRISGVMNYSFDEFRLEPRDNGDLIR